MHSFARHNIIKKITTKEQNSAQKMKIKITNKSHKNVFKGTGVSEIHYQNKFNKRVEK